jgi:hypothetical protein
MHEHIIVLQSWLHHSDNRNALIGPNTVAIKPRSSSELAGLPRGGLESPFDSEP